MLPSVDSPAALRGHWERCVRPRLEGMLARMGRASDASDLGARLDAYLWVLRDCQAAAAHCRARHADPDWRTAAADVEAGARKYQQFAFSARSLARRLRAQLRKLEASGEGGEATAALLRALLAQFDQSGALVQDARTGLAALESPDAAKDALARARQREAQLLEALDGVMDGAGMAPVVEVPVSPGDPVLRPFLVAAPGMEGADGGAAGPHTPRDHSSMGATAGSPPAAAGPAAEAEGAGPPAAAVVLTRSVVARMLGLHPNGAVRQAAYAAGLLPRLRAAGRLLGELARCRADMAVASQLPSYGHLALQPCLVRDPGEVAALLTSLTDALRPLAARQLDGLASAWEAAGHGALQPWDLERAEALVRQQAGLDVAAAELAPYLALDSALCGLSSLLQALLGVRLVPRQLPAAERVGTASSRALAVVSASRGLVGTLYVDPGGGYGTRMVRLGGPPAAGAGPGGSSSAGTPLQEAGGPGQNESEQQQQQQAGGTTDHPDLQLLAGLPAASVGLGAELAEGGSLTPAALWELMHEAGHAVHLLLSSSGQPHLHLGGRFLPPDWLELPSHLFERLALHPPALAAVCRHRDTGAPMPAPLAARLARQLAARQCGPLALQDKWLAALADQAYGAMGAQADAETWFAAWGQWSSPAAALGCAGTSRLLGILPVLAASRGRYHRYPLCWACARLLWGHTLAPLVDQACRQLGTQQAPADLAAAAEPDGLQGGGGGGGGGSRAAGDAAAAAQRRQRLAAIMQAGAALSRADLVALVCGVDGGGGPGQEPGQRLAAVLAGEAGAQVAQWVWLPPEPPDM